MAMFDPRPFGPVPERLSVVPSHGESWLKKWANWWGGATIASPTTNMTGPAAHALGVIRERQADLSALNQYFVDQTEYARQWTRQVLGVPEDEPVILDASGTAAILTSSRIISHVAAGAGGEFWTLTTDEGGSLVPATLKGRNPNELEKVMFQPVTRLFYDQDAPVLPYPQGLRVTARMLHVTDHTNGEMLEAIRQAVVSATGPGCIMLPHVTKTGRILPIRQVGQLVAELSASGRRVFYIVDDIQGISRVSPEAVADPTSFCDAYLFGSSKALGGILIASAVVMRRELLDTFVAKVSRTGAIQTPCIPHFQFSPEWQERLGERLLKPSAVSLPEIVSMRAALYHLWTRGTQETFEQRRAACLEQIREKLRPKLVEGLLRIPGMKVLETTPERPLVPSIVCFRVERERWTPGGLKDALQESDPIITPSAPIGRWVRLDIPEYRPMPSVEILVSALKRLLG
jgi:selenocysteine lyase/cysteine desulfurase